MPRQCPFNGCDKRIPAEMFSCRPHWYSLNKAKRDEIWRAYREWQAGRIDGAELRRIQQGVLGARGTA